MEKQNILSLQESLSFRFGSESICIDAVVFLKRKAETAMRPFFLANTYTYNNVQLMIYKPLCSYKVKLDTLFLGITKSLAHLWYDFKHVHENMLTLYNVCCILTLEDLNI